MAETPDDRFAHGMETLEKVFPLGSAAMPQFRYPPEIEKDWGHFSVSTVLGDVWSRPGLELKHRTMIAIAALAALNKPGSLKAYIIAGLKQGLSRSEVCEIIFQMAIYAGFPAAIEAFGHAREAFEQFDRASGST
jgi:4-carboxymuconolactone decarboxylase